MAELPPTLQGTAKTIVERLDQLLSRVKSHRSVLLIQTPAQGASPLAQNAVPAATSNVPLESLLAEAHTMVNHLHDIFDDFAEKV